VKNLERKLIKRRDALLQCYDEEHLHQLRITLRRMRSRLKQQSGKKNRNLRRDLGLLAETTNAARDWDTLVLRARNILPEEQFEYLLPRLEHYQYAAHQQVLVMLESREWMSAIKRWRQFLDEERREQAEVEDDRGRDLSKILRQVSSARLKALSQNDEKRWHKLRIAVKELRYALDATPKKKRTKSAAKTIELCKALQEDLGEWHDTVVHGQLLLELADSLDPVSQPAVADALDILRTSIAQRGRDKLERVTLTLQKPKTGKALSPVNPAPPAQ
jgi:CHAD domain-containing protein